MLKKNEQDLALYFFVIWHKNATNNLCNKDASTKISMKVLSYQKLTGVTNQEIIVFSLTALGVNLE